MTIASDRVDFNESDPNSAFYCNYLLAQKNGKHALTFFWGFLRHKLERGLLESYFDEAYRTLNLRALRDGTGSKASTGGTIRVTFSFGCTDIKARCLKIADSYRISMADTVRMLLISSQLHEAGTAVSPMTAATTSCTDGANSVSAMGSGQGLAAATSTPSAMLNAPNPIELNAPIANRDAPRTQFCKKTQQWKMFKPMRPNSTMTTERLRDISAMGGAYEVMDSAELAQHGLCNPVAESNDDVQAAVTETGSTGANVVEIHSKPQPLPATTSREAQHAFAMTMFAAADRMLENPE